ncbi:hypothetical protein [Paraburkholderia aspalathi]
MTQLIAGFAQAQSGGEDAMPRGLILSRGKKALELQSLSKALLT